MLLANGSTLLVPAGVGADNLASWLRDTPVFSPADFAARFPELAEAALLRLAHSGALAPATDR